MALWLDWISLSEPALQLTALVCRLDKVEPSKVPPTEKLDRDYMGRRLQLTLLAPSLIDVVLNGSPCPFIGRPRLMKFVPATWREQVVEPT